MCYRRISLTFVLSSIYDSRHLPIWVNSVWLDFRKNEAVRRVTRLPQNWGVGWCVRASSYWKSQNDQEKRGSDAIASLMRHPEFDTHTIKSLHKKETCRDCYVTLAVLVYHSSFNCRNLAFLDSRVLRQILSGKMRQWGEWGICLKIEAWGGAWGPRFTGSRKMTRKNEAWHTNHSCTTR